MRYIPILIISIFLLGCGTLKNSPDVPSISPNPIVFSPEVLEECSLLDEVGTLYSFEDVLFLYGSLVTQYAKCANKQSTSIKLLKNVGNIK